MVAALRDTVIRATMPRRTLAHELSGVRWRLVLDVFALTLSLGLLAWRVNVIRERSRVEWSARTAQFAVVQDLYNRLVNYSETYGRPVFMWTGVRHVSPAESTLYERLRLDLLDPRVRYWYDDTHFRIAWYDAKQSRRPDRNQIVIQGEWPAEARWYAYMRWYVNHPAPNRKTTYVK